MAGPMRYKKTTGFANMRGEQFEVKKAAHLYLRSVNLGLDFQLAVNVSGAGALDDIIYKYRLNAASDWHTCFIQLKHKDNEAAVLTDTLLNAPSGPFSLRKYLQSYREIRQTMNNPVRDVLFEGSFSMCRFVIYTNAVASQTLLKRSTDVSSSEEALILRADSVQESILRPHRELVFVEKEDHTEEDFLNKVVLMCGQPSESQFERLNKKEMGARGDGAYRIFEELFRAWWQNGDTILDRRSLILDVAAALALEERITPLEEARFRLPIVFLDVPAFTVADGSLLNVMAETCIELSCTKVLQALAKRKAEYVFTGSERLNVDTLRGTMLAWKNGAKPLLVMVGELRDDIWTSVCEQLNSDARLQVIYVHDARKPLPVALNDFERVSDTFLMSQLEEPSADSILDLRVNFQGSDVTFRDIFHGDLDQAHAFLGSRIPQVLRAPCLSVGRKLEAVFHHYIPRAVTETNTIRPNILKDMRETDKLVFSGITEPELRYVCTSKAGAVRDAMSKISFLALDDGGEEEFNALCKRHDNVHWIHVTGGAFKWRKSHGSLELVKKHLDTQTSSERAVDLNQRLVLLVAEPGMGKSTLMGHLAETEKLSRPNAWVLRITLNEHARLLGEYGKGAGNVSEVLARACGIALLPQLDRDLLDVCVNVIGNVVVLLDGYDEIAPRYSGACCDFVSALLATRVRSIWITSRPSISDRLERHLSTLPVSLAAFTEQDQRAFLSRYWSDGVTPAELLDARVTGILSLVEESIRLFAGIPLQTLMLAEVYRDLTDLPERLDLLELLEKFVERKFRIYYRDKLKRDPWDADYEDDYSEKHGAFQERHRLAAMTLLVDTESLREMVTVEAMEKSKKFLEDVRGGKEKSGIITKVTFDTPSFVHRVFAEYFLAAWLAGNPHNARPFLRQHLYHERYEAVTHMFDRMLARGCPSHVAVLDNVFQWTLEQVDSRDLGGRTLLHLACTQGAWSDSVSSVERLLQGADSCAPDQALEWTPVQYAISSRSFNVVETFLRTGRLERTDEGLRRLVTDETAWAAVVEEDHVHLLAALLDNGLSVNATFSDGDSLLHAAADFGQAESCALLVQEGGNVAKRNNHSETPLHRACCEGHADIVRILLDSSRFDGTKDKTEYIDMVDKEGQNALHSACMEGHEEIVNILIDAGANIKNADAEGRTPLHLAADEGHVEIVNLLLNSIVDDVERVEYVNLRDKEGLTAIVLSRSEGHSGVADALREAGARVVTNVRDQMAPLYDAIRTNQASVVWQVIDQLKDQYKHATVNMRDGKGRPPLVLASGFGFVDIVDILLEAGACIYSSDNSNQTALHVASKNGHTAVVRRLLEIEDVASVLNNRDTDGDSALDLAVIEGHVDIVDILVKAGVKLSFTNSRDQTPLHVASENGHANIARLLIDGVLDSGERLTYLNAKDADYQTALSLAAWQNHVTVVDVLISAGADVTLVSDDGRTPLHDASGNGRAALAQRLIDSFADDKDKIEYVDALDSLGHSAIEIAHLGNHREVVGILIKAGGDPTTLENDEMKPLHDAIRNRDAEQVKLLIDNFPAGEEKVNKCDFAGKSPVFLASSDGSIDIVDILLAAGADVTKTDLHRRSPLHVASLNGHLEVVRRLIENVPAGVMPASYISSPDEDYLTALTLAAWNDHASVVSVLIEAGAVFDNPDESLILVACDNGSSNVVRLLVEIVGRESAADYVKRGDESGQSPMWLACLGNHAEVVSVLLEAGGNMDLTCGLVNSTLLQEMCRLGHKRIVRMLLDSIDCPERRTEYLNKCDDIGRSAFYFAIQECHMDVADMLIEAGVDVTVGILDERTPLMMACTYGNMRLVRRIVDNIGPNLEAHVNASDRDYGSPLHLAVQKGYADVVDILLEAGANPFHIFLGRTPFHEACRQGHLSIAKALLSFVPLEKRTDYLNAEDGHSQTAITLAMPNMLHLLNSVLDGSYV